MQARHSGSGASNTDAYLSGSYAPEDGTYAVKKENYDFAKKICRPVVSRVEQAEADHFVSDCPMAGDLIEHGMSSNDNEATSAFALLRSAYGV